MPFSAVSLMLPCLSWNRKPKAGDSNAVICVPHRGKTTPVGLLAIPLVRVPVFTAETFYTSF